MGRPDGKRQPRHRGLGWVRRGPRLPALAWQLSLTLGEADLIDAIARGYREHVQRPRQRGPALRGVA